MTMLRVWVRRVRCLALWGRSCAWTRMQSCEKTTRIIFGSLGVVCSMLCDVQIPFYFHHEFHRTKHDVSTNHRHARVSKHLGRYARGGLGYIKTCRTNFQFKQYIFWLMELSGFFARRHYTRSTKQLTGTDNLFRRVNPQKGEGPCSF